ncbi:MAG: metallophosphoesterase family protein [Haloferacaceae archaeon]
MRLALVSDTHVPSRAAEIPDWVEAEIRAADHTLHAGDFESQATLDRVNDLADGDLTAVAGNADGPGLGLPEVATFEGGGATFVAVHGTGSPSGYVDRVVRAVEDAAGDDGTESAAGGGDRGSVVGVCGHIHEHVDDVVDGVRLLNPGSATGAEPASEATMLTAEVEDGTVDATLYREGEPVSSP